MEQIVVTVLHAIVSSEPLAATLAAAVWDVNMSVVRSTPASRAAIAGIRGVARFEMLV